MNPIVEEPLHKKHDPFFERFEHLEQLIEGQGKILEMISKGVDLKTILNEIIFWAEKESKDGVLASILLTNYNGQKLLHGAAPSLPEDYNNAIHGITIGPNIGSCGTAAYTKQQVIAEDIATDPLWKDFRSLASRYGLAACWSTPLITKEGNVLGTFAMYYRHPKKPSPHDLQIIRLISNTTVIAIEWAKAEEQKRVLLETEQITNLKLAEEKHRFYNLLMNAPAMVSVMRGPEHVYELANPLYMKAIGSDRKVIGKTVREALPELHGQGIFELLDKVYETGEPFFGNELLVQLDRGDNGTLEDGYFNFTYQPIRNSNGKIEGIFVHAVDVTELVKARKKAEKSEEKFKSFVLNSPMPIGIYVGREMRIQTANAAILKAWEKDKSVIGKTFREALPELEGQPFYDILDNVYTSGIAYEAIEERVDLMRDGKLTTTYWNFSYTPLKNESGEIYGVMNTAAEVTELVSAKKNLSSAQQTLKTAIEMGGLGTWQINLRNNHVTYDEPIIKWFGLPADGTSLENIISRIDEKDQATIAAAVQYALDNNEEYQAEYRVSNPHTHRERVLHARGRLICDDEGNQLYLNGICRDITLQKETEKELTRQVEYRTKELQKANAGLNTLNENLKQFVYVASHDLQEPLRKINMFSDVLVSKSGHKLDEQQQLYISKISHSARRMSNLIKDLLDFSRAEANDRSFVDVNLEQVINNVIEDYEMLIQQKNAAIQIDALPFIKGIPLQMNQLFYNLVGNALKFSKADVSPVVTIHAAPVTKQEVQAYEGLDPVEQYVRISVSDNGIGFDQQFAEQIFVIFQRLHGREEYEGTGIGLALCKKIAENHKGLISAESKPKEGATFHVVLPAAF